MVSQSLRFYLIFSSISQTEWFQFTYHQVCWLLFLKFKSVIKNLSWFFCVYILSLEFLQLIFFKYILSFISDISLARYGSNTLCWLFRHSFNSLNIFRTANLMSLCNIWAPSGTTFVDFFFCIQVIISCFCVCLIHF